jgi:fructosamine-3-kinase
VTLPPGASDAQRVGGGDINEAFKLRLADGREAFVKTRADAAPGEYEAEAAGLRWLAEPGALRTPAVLELDERYMALEWVPPGRLGNAGGEELGRGLALTHRAGAERFGAPPGAGEAAGFGSLRLGNADAADWPSFFAEQRLAPLTRMARDRGALPPRGVEALERICERLTELCGTPEPPSRLHGDLWAGNVMADEQGGPWLIDPSAYGGHREVDLAMLRLFGAPSARIFDSYEDTWPLSDGWQERVELYQLAPLLVHALLFGGSYAGAAERVALKYS